MSPKKHAFENIRSRNPTNVFYALVPKNIYIYLLQKCITQTDRPTVEELNWSEKVWPPKSNLYP